MNKTIFAAFVLLIASPLAAAETPAAKIDTEDAVYRVNLGRADDIALLIKQGLPADQLNEEGVPLLALASARKDAEGLVMVKTLMGAGANIDLPDRNGQTPLFYAARRGNLEIVQYLLENGASYYLTDNRGDIARTLAHREGYKNIVEAMDDFVVAQTEKVNQQYQDMNKALEQRYKEEQQQREKALETPAAATEEPKAEHEVSAEPEAPAEEPQPPASAPAPEPQASPVDKVALDKATQELSFHACAFQYWSFCKAARQTTEFSEEELDTAIDSHKEKVLALSRDLMETHRATRRDVDRVSDRSKRHVFNPLSSMPSRTYRFEHGVGKMADMEKRCRYISTHWEDAIPGQPARKPARRSKGYRGAR
jgi:hypothetical protein